MPVSDYQECYLADQMGLLGERREDLRVGILGATIANLAFALGGMRPGAEPYKPDDFMIPEPKPNGETPKQSLTPEQMLGIVMAWQAGNNV